MFVVFRSYMAVFVLEGTEERRISETPFETKEAADAYIREMVELNPGVEMDFFIREV